MYPLRAYQVTLTTEVGIYKKKEENTLSTKKAIKKKREKKDNTLSTKKATKKNFILFLILVLVAFLMESVYFFCSYLFSFLNSHSS